MTPVLTSRTIGLLPLALLSLLFVAPAGCKAKPSEKDCKAAINNVRRINQQDSSDMGADPIAMIRSCRGSSNQKSVDCMIRANTEEDLRKCEGDVGDKYFKNEKEATEKRIKESAGQDEGGATPKETAPKEAAPKETAPKEATP